MRHRRHWLLASAVLAISACSLYPGSADHTPHLTEPDAAISDHDGGCGGAGDGGGYLPDGGVYDNDGGGGGGVDAGGNDGGGWGGNDGGGAPDAGYGGNDGGGYGGVDAGGYGNDGGGYLPDAH